MNHIGFSLFSLVVFLVISRSQGFVVLQNVNGTINKSALVNKSLDCSSGDRDSSCSVNLVLTDDFQISNSTESNAKGSSYLDTSQNDKMKNIDKVSTLSRSSMLPKRSNLPDDFILLNTTGSNIVVTEQSDCPEEEINMTTNDIFSTTTDSSRTGNVLNSTVVSYNDSTLVNITNSNFSIDGRSEILINNTVIKSELVLESPMKSESCDENTIPDDSLVLIDTKPNFNELLRSELSNSETITECNRQHWALKMSGEMILPDDSHYLDLPENETILVSEREKGASDISGELILPDDPRLIKDNDLDFKVLDRADLPESETILGSEREKGASEISGELILPDDPRLIKDTESYLKDIERSDLPENEIVTKSDRQSDFEIYGDLILPDDYNIENITDFLTSIFERSALSEGGKPTHSAPAESTTIYDAELVLDRVDIPENDKMMQSTTEKLLDNKNIFDVPKNECEEGMRRDRRGKCRSVLHGPSGK